MDEIKTFLLQYDETVIENANIIRQIILAKLPGIIEQLDKPAKMISYSFGNKYSDMICTIIPSKKGIKLGFYKGNELTDPLGLLCGTGKTSRYLVVNTKEQINNIAIEDLLQSSFIAYTNRKKI